MEAIRDRFFEVGFYNNQEVLLVDTMIMDDHRLKFKKEVWLEEKRRGRIEIGDIILDKRKDDYFEIKTEEGIKECIHSLGENGWILYKKFVLNSLT